MHPLNSPDAMSVPATFVVSLVIVRSNYRDNSSILIEVEVCDLITTAVNVVYDDTYVIGELIRIVHEGELRHSVSISDNYGRVQ